MKIKNALLKAFSNTNVENPNIDDRMILQKGEEYIKKIDNIIEKGNKGVDVLNDIENIRAKIKSFRQSGLDSGGEYSYENLTFKLLRRNGYIGKLLKLKIWEHASAVSQTL